MAVGAPAIGERGRIYKTRHRLAYLNDEHCRWRILTQYACLEQVIIF
jgi:TnpA family transposase